MMPLAGIRILDFSRILAGPMATQILAELGAEVIKIERPVHGDDTRSFEPRLPKGESAYFFACNRAKRSLTLDLKCSRGQEIARALAMRVDVVLENFLPGHMDKFGLGYPRLAEANPRLIYVSSTGFGQTGPYRDRKGYDTIFQALSGVMALTGYPGAPPAKVGLPFADLTSALWIAIAILTATVGRNSTGRGCYIDLSMMDAQVSLLSIAAARLFALGSEPQRSGTEHPGRVPTAAFACRDGAWLHITGSDHHWPVICRVLGLDDLAADTRLSSNKGRLAHRELIMARMTDAVMAHDRASLAAALRAAGVPAGEVNSVREALEDAHVRARGVVAHFDHPRESSFPALRNPLRFEGFDNPHTGTPPLLGADTADLLAELGLNEAEIAGLRDEGVL